MRAPSAHQDHRPGATGLESRLGRRLLVPDIVLCSFRGTRGSAVVGGLLPRGDGPSACLGPASALPSRAGDSGPCQARPRTPGCVFPSGSTPSSCGAPPGPRYCPPLARGSARFTGLGRGPCGARLARSTSRTRLPSILPAPFPAAPAPRPVAPALLADAASAPSFSAEFAKAEPRHAGHDGADVAPSTRPRQPVFFSHGFDRGDDPVDARAIPPSNRRVREELQGGGTAHITNPSRSRSWPR